MDLQVPPGRKGIPFHLTDFNAQRENMDLQSQLFFDRKKIPFLPRISG